MALGVWMTWLQAALDLIPNMMYLSRVNAQTQFKSESLKPRGNTINTNPRTWCI